MRPRVWAKSTYNGTEYEYISLTPETLEGSLEVMRKSFFIYEKANIGVELAKDHGAAKELEEMCIHAAKDGVSIVAVEQKTGKVVGVNYNKIKIKGSNDYVDYLTEYAARCKHPSAKASIEFSLKLENLVDIFDVTKTDCVIEMMYEAVLPEHEHEGIATNLLEALIKLTKTLKFGKNVKVPLDDQPLPPDPIPTVITVACTCKAMEKICKYFGCYEVIEVSYENFTFGGKTYASRIGPEEPCLKIVYIKFQ